MIRDLAYYESLLLQLRHVIPHATTHGIGVRVEWHPHAPLVVATPRIPAGMVEEITIEEQATTEQP